MCHHGLEFSDVGIFSVLVWVIPGFFHIIYPFSFSVMFFPFPKLFCFLCIQLLVYPRAFLIYFLVELSFVILESHCLTLSRYLSSLVSFANVFCFISFSGIVRLFTVLFWSFQPNASLHVLPSLALFFVIIISLPCPPCLISYPDFAFLFEFRRGTLILSLTSFASA